MKIILSDELEHCSEWDLPVLFLIMVRHLARCSL